MRPSVPYNSRVQVSDEGFSNHRITDNPSALVVMLQGRERDRKKLIEHLSNSRDFPWLSKDYQREPVLR